MSLRIVNTPTRPVVILADHNPQRRRRLERKLASSCDVQSTSRLNVAHDLAEERPPDLVVSSMLMPGAGALEVMARARHNGRRHPTALIFDEGISFGTCSATYARQRLLAGESIDAIAGRILRLASDEAGKRQAA